MTGRKKKTGPAGRNPRARDGRGRQRQHLIDACISALHIYGPSRTTVEKVVAIAKMSPGIVRFYFDSKAAMLVASLQFLATEFEERLLMPVAELKSNPVAALQSMVDLYLDPDIASPRKVSVWYAFWGEASSRKEYYDICGQKDESFAALVRELIGKLIIDTAQPHLDPDGIALGLIGCLEIIWQDIAFQSERNIDRGAAKRRCMAYLSSIFPGQFSPLDTRSTVAPPVGATVQQAAARVPDEARQHALERRSLFRDAWFAVGLESEIRRTGEFLTIDIGAERVLVVRDSSGIIHALRNNCPRSPHALVTQSCGQFEGVIECKPHELQFSWEGRSVGPSRGADLSALELLSVGGLMFVRPAADGPPQTARRPRWALDIAVPAGLMRLGPAVNIAVQADWKILVEQWLERAPHDMTPNPAADSLAWNAAVLAGARWSAQRYGRLVDCVAQRDWWRCFVAPNQLLEIRPDGMSVVQAVPAAPGQCVLRRLDYSVLPPNDSARAVLYLVQRLGPYARRSMLEIAQSIQQGTAEFGYAAAREVSPAVSWFRERLAARTTCFPPPRRAPLEH